MSQANLSPITVSGKFDRMGESLKTLREYSVEAAKQAGLPMNRVNGLRLAVDEYATNIIIYGYHDAGIDGDIRAAAKIDDYHLIISLVDTALEFDPTTRANPTDADLEADLFDRPIGGLGIKLVRDNVDEWRYERQGNRNCNHFVLKRK
jgi:anti-sigma regulatory factor (Ser/Thr protein kinase)